MRREAIDELGLGHWEKDIDWEIRIDASPSKRPKSKRRSTEPNARSIATR